MNRSRAISLMIHVLLAALFISSGEGVRLFPIPVTNAQQSAENSTLIGSTKRNHYHYSTHGFSGFSNFSTTKVVKKKSAADADDYPAGGSLSPDFNTDPRAKARVTSQTPAVPSSEYVTELPPGRAPPA